MFAVIRERNMAFLLQILLAVVLTILSALYLLGAFRQRRLGEPPLDKGLLPWLGHVLEFRRDTVKFLERMKLKHGKIFTVQLGGFYFTFLTDPQSFGSVIKEARSNLDFTEFARHLVEQVFGYRSLGNDHKLIQVSSNKYLMGDGLVAMTQAMMNNLQNLMLHSWESQRCTDRAWQEEGLFTYCYNVVFRAGYLALFGNQASKTAEGSEKSKKVDRSQSEDLFQEFRKYDQLFPNLAYGVLGPMGKREAERLKKLFWKVLSSQNMDSRENISDWIWDARQSRAELGVDTSMLDRYMFVLLWASQGNTGPSSFWLLLFLLKHPEAMQAVKDEVDLVLHKTGQSVTPGGPLINLTRDMLLQTPVLDSAVEETLRMTTAPMLTRAVLEDMRLKMADGTEYRLRKGDRVSMFPYTAVQMDPEVHPDPHTFKYDRFLTEDGTKKTDFYKSGKKLKYYNMPWGAGSTMCPGRFFATNELKQFIFLMLTYFDFELKSPDEKIPDIDTQRWGFGTMQPNKDIQFRYRLRA